MILNETIPYDVLTSKPLPGIGPLDEADWLRINEAYAPQLAEKALRLRESRSEVIMLDEAARPAAEELLELVIQTLAAKEGFALEAGTMCCPDGRSVALDTSDPLGTIARLAQEDMCILEKRGDEHVLVGAILCFPSSWRLSEKFLRPLIAIHEPVESYGADVAKRVQRLFDGVKVGRPLWRFNALWYVRPDLYQPRSAHEPRDDSFVQAADFMRSELQTMRRLPKTDAVVFGIHTYVLARKTLEQGA